MRELDDSGELARCRGGYRGDPLRCAEHGGHPLTDYLDGPPSSHGYCDAHRIWVNEGNARSARRSADILQDQARDHIGCAEKLEEEAVRLRRRLGCMAELEEDA